MATISGGGNYMANVNAQFTKDLAKGDSQAAISARNNTGQTAQQKKTAEPQTETHESGITFSDAAHNQLKSETEQHAEFVSEHGAELAQQTGVQQSQDSPQNDELQRKRGYDREQAEVGQDQTPPGFVKVDSPNGQTQLITVSESENLKRMDDPDLTDNRVLGDIPEKSLAAASAVVDTQMATGVSKIAGLKTDPKVEGVTRTLESSPVPVLAEPLDIRDAGNDPRNLPLPMEFPVEMEQVAAEKAASDLASGGFEQEAMIAGFGAYTAGQ